MQTNRPATQSRSRRHYAAPALEKGIDIIELLSREKNPLPARQIAERLGRSKGEIFRVLAVLEDRGYIERAAGTDDFLVTNRLFDLGMRSPPARSLQEAALPVMNQLADTIGQSCHLAVPNRGQTVVVAHAESRGEVSFAVRLGYRRSLADSTSGLAILAFQTQAMLDHWLDQVRALPAALPDPDELTAILRRIRERGYEVAPSRDVVGITDIGCPILDQAGTAVACLTVPYVNRVVSRNNMLEVVDAVRSAAARIGEAAHGDLP